MGWVVVVVLAIALIVYLAVRYSKRRPRDGVDEFRRHMDALSSDSRRSVIDRIRDARNGREG